VLDVFFAGPHHLDGAIDLLGHAHGRDHHVGLELAPEAAASRWLLTITFSIGSPAAFAASDCTRS